MTISRKAVKIMASLLGLAALAGALWWGLFGLKPYTITDEALRARYAYSPPAAGIEVQQTAEPGHARALLFKTFDGSEVQGRIVYPSDPATARRPFPLLIGLHAMGRSHVRWWQDEFKQRPTKEQTHRITALALQQGYAVLALDARNHGARKDLAYTLRDVMQDLHYWGKREPYEQMIIDTVRDYRLLLDWVQTQPQLDANQIRVAGYSMGAQMALLIGGLDPRVKAVLAIVPPHLDNKVAAAAPHNLLAGLAGKKVWLLSADDDEHADQADNAALFEAIPSQNKQHLRFDGGHLLPASYVEALLPWF
ncbi:MAG: alpha/beta fold hydrolase [Burkholderiaceae bacterium]|nr:alpha/beta fold hydrolase [Burkholderiaceae bacterium]